MNCLTTATTVSLFLIAGSFISSNSHAASVDEIALYNKPDRQNIFIEGAKKEGKVSWYTSLIVDQVVRAVKDRFPGYAVSYLDKIRRTRIASL